MSVNFLFFSSQLISVPLIDAWFIIMLSMKNVFGPFFFFCSLRCCVYALNLVAGLVGEDL